MVYVRKANIGLLAGIVAGLVVGGIGGRIAMRIVALAIGQQPKFTVGTLAVLLVGTLLGTPPGLLYIAARKYLPGSGLRKGLVFGVLLLLIIGLPALLRPATGELVLSPRLGRILFGALFIPYGVAVEAAVERLDRYLPAAGQHRMAMALGVILLAIPCLMGLFAIVSLIFDIRLD